MLTNSARRLSVYIAARAGFSWLPLVLMAIIASIWAVTKNALQAPDAGLRTDEIIQLVCVLYVERAFVVFMALLLAVGAESWWDAESLADRERESAVIFWSGVLKTARWSVAIAFSSICIAFVARRSTTDGLSTLALLSWIASTATLLAAVVAVQLSTKSLRSLPAQRILNE